LRTAAVAAAQPVVVRVSAGFQWRDALVGAVAVLGLELAGAGGALVLRARRMESTERRQDV
jgi:hypothetical protein